MLKLAEYSDRYRALLPAAVHAEECPRAWPAFRTQVLEQDAATRAWAIADRAFRGNPVAVLQQLQTGSSRQAPGLAEQKLEADPPPCTSRAVKQVTQGHLQQALTAYRVAKRDCTTLRCEWPASSCAGSTQWSRQLPLTGR